MKDTNLTLKRIVDHYFESRDFNGIALSQLFSIDLDPDGEDKALQKAKSILKELIQKRCIDLNFEKYSVNPHIIMLEFPNAEIQLQSLNQITGEDIGYCCAYPSKEYIKEKVDITKYKRYKEYKDKPFTLLLAQGEPQLSHRAFDLRVLEFYRNDPRYYYNIYGGNMGGEVYSKDDEKSSLDKKDQIFLQTFGFAYDEKMNRYVAVYLRYLSNLTTDHQDMWSRDEFQGTTELHPDYERVTIMGEFPAKISIFEAFIKEIEVINEMTIAINKKGLFKNVYAYNADMSKDFCFLIRPTKSEYEKFIQLLDKMTIDNINGDFFDNNVKSLCNSDRTKVNKNIKLLYYYFRNFRFESQDDSKYFNETIETLKYLRKKRNLINHTIQGGDEWDKQYFQEQRNLIIRAYKVIRFLRLILTNHPDAQKIEVPDHLYKGYIRDY